MKRTLLVEKTGCRQKENHSDSALNNQALKKTLNNQKLENMTLASQKSTISNLENQKQDNMTLASQKSTISNLENQKQDNMTLASQKSTISTPEHHTLVNYTLNDNCSTRNSSFNFRDELTWLKKF